MFGVPAAGVRASVEAEFRYYYKSFLFQGISGMRAGPLLALAFALALHGQDLKQAEALYQHTDYNGAIRVLRAIANPDARTLALLGRSYFMDGDFKKATDSLQKAVALDPNNSEYMLWLGRTWGRRAETASPFVAPMNAGHARDCFQKAVALDPANKEALSDLFDYYLEAPGFLGGGFDKAANVARQIERIDPAEGHYAQAQLARKRQEYGEVESQLRRAMELAPRQVGRVVDLAKFLARQGRIQESEAALAQADRLAPGSPRLLYERASIYVEAHQHLDQARELLKKYLQSNLTADDPPREDAQKLLRKVAGA
ncbi:MAG TPA: tetratricopeptide repeat protein [Bryobacteraceae bacterium]|nr:tetratricopeptide repeat protein [Bryobacteraceae bacterium]